MQLLAGVFFVAFAAVTLKAAAPSVSPRIEQGGVLTVDALGKGSAPLDGPWQFHLGDDPAWAQPSTADAAGLNGWEQISAGKSWGEQGHADYTGFAWYRKHIHLSFAPGVQPDVAMLIRHIDDAYEIYWNGRLIGSYGSLPPHPSFAFTPPQQTFGLGDVRDGVLAFRVWKAPLMSFDTGLGGGLVAAPVVGSPKAIADLKTENDYGWMRSRQFYFAMRSLYGLLAFLSLLAWFRNRSQRVLLWITLFSAAPIADMFLEGLRLNVSFVTALGWLQPVFALQDIGLWFLLLSLLKLDENPRLVRATRVLALISITSASLDGLLCIFWDSPSFGAWTQWTDAVLTAIFTTVEAYPLVLVAFGVRKRLDSSRWLLAICAFLTEMLFVAGIALRQGSRFTHWTIGDKLGDPLFNFNGNAFTPLQICDVLLLLAIIYAVYRYMQETLRHQGALEQELKSAQELQQILIPESLPELPGYSVTSAYRPAQEVGGDFFQIIPLEGEAVGCTLILLGDVSGKGLKAAMTVSLIVGAARTAARFAPNPADVLAELNTRLYGRMQGGFTTCLAMRLSPDGSCTMASAGHPGPFLNQNRLELPGALPLGVLPNPGYKEESITLREGDHFSLYTDGLLEARNTSGEIFSFERLDALFATHPNAAEATEAAVNFGQDDDITVVTLIRLASGQQASTRFIAQSLATV